MDRRLHRVQWGQGRPRVRTSKSNWNLPLRWNAEAERAGVRRRVFCASLADVFDHEVDPAWRWALFRLIRATPALTWMLLTKRIGLARDKLNDAAAAVANDEIGALTWDRDPWPNVWLGATIVNQAEADRDIQKLLETPAAKRFVSYEPALGPVDWRRWMWPVHSSWPAEYASPEEAAAAGAKVTRHRQALVSSSARYLDWIIVGGESHQPGMPARPFAVEWALSTIAQCRDAGVACFVKQVGSRPTLYGDYPPFEQSQHSIELRGEYDGDPIPFWFRDRAGADPAEWPADLRVQEIPT